MKTVLIVITVLLATYCLVAFITWETNPAEWGALTRFAAAWLGACLSPIVAMGAK